MFNLKKNNNMKAYLYHIEAITNLQVCSGEENFGVVDNLIQRDAATGFPAINASSLKGALREYFNENLSEDKIKVLFGSKPNEQNNPNVGALRFLDAHLLAMPVRTNRVPYLMATCPMLVRDYIQKCKLLDLPITFDEAKIDTILNSAQQSQPFVSCDKYKGVYIEDLDKKTAHTKGLNDLGKIIGIGAQNLVLFHDDDFKKICDNNHLPIIARNCLEREHKNLWYEQVLPRFTQMYFIILADDNSDLSEFTTALSSQLLQIGANASVGYGFCQINQVK